MGVLEGVWLSWFESWGEKNEKYNINADRQKTTEWVHVYALGGFFLDHSVYSICMVGVFGLGLV